MVTGQECALKESFHELWFRQTVDQLVQKVSPRHMPERRLSSFVDSKLFKVGISRISDSSTNPDKVFAFHCVYQRIQGVFVFIDCLSDYIFWYWRLLDFVWNWKNTVSYLHGLPRADLDLVYFTCKANGYS